jgi:D-alanine-D-alanine ligase
VIFGGRSGEHQISLMSARSVIEALDPEKYQVVQIGITHQGHWITGKDVLAILEANSAQGADRVTLLPEPGTNGLLRWAHNQILQEIARLDMVFPVLHGSYGEDGTLQGLLEMADIPYVGAGVLASAVAMDKGLCKHVLRANRLPVADWTIILSSELERDPQASVARAVQVADFPLFTKPANLGSSVGVSKCRSRSDLLEGMLDAARYDRRVLVEAGVPAREIEVSVLGNEQPQASIPGEVIPSDEFYSYNAKYIDGRSQLLIPAPLEPAIAQAAQQLAVDSFAAIDGAGMARVDFLLHRESGELFINEINTIPGFTRISMYPKLWEASGMSFPELLDQLIELGFQRQSQKDRLLRRYGEQG